jgi:hypothetical protein
MRDMKRKMNPQKSANCKRRPKCDFIIVVFFFAIFWFDQQDWQDHPISPMTISNIVFLQSNPPLQSSSQSILSSLFALQSFFIFRVVEQVDALAIFFCLFFPLHLYCAKCDFIIVVFLFVIFWFDRQDWQDHPISPMTIGNIVLIEIKFAII